MPLVLTRPDEIPNRGSICIYGPTGVGKTTLLGTMPGNGLVVEVRLTEDGAYVLADKADRITVVYVSRWDELDEVFKNMQPKGIWHGKFNWVALDSVTGLQELAKRKVIGEREMKAAPHKVTQPEFGHIGNLVTEAVIKFKTLDDVWVLFVAQERKHGGGDDDPGPVMIGPDVLPSALRGLTPPMMLVGRLFVQSGVGGELERGLRIGSNELYIAKCRALPGKKPPAVVKDPDLGDLLMYLLRDGKRPKRLQTEMEL